MAKLLFVEDEKNLRTLYHAEFSSDGHEVLIARSGEEALALLQREHPDVLILDIRLEGMDGLAAMQRILQLQPDLPVVINSAYSSFMDDFKSWPAHAYVIKSSDLTELKARVADCLRFRVDGDGSTAAAPSTTA